MHTNYISGDINPIRRKPVGTYVGSYYLINKQEFLIIFFIFFFFEFKSYLSLPRSKKSNKELIKNGSPN